MEALHVVNGLSDIKTELIQRCGIGKTPQELSLWFSFEKDVLYVHDTDQHDDCIIVALWNETGWRIYLDPKGFGYAVAEYVIRLAGTKDKLAKEFNRIFKLHGFRPFNRS